MCTTTVRDERGLSRVLFLLVATFLAACPGTESTEVRIDDAPVIAGSLTTSEFELQVIGRGFGLQRVSYNVATGDGVGGTNGLEVELIVGPTRRAVLAQSVIVSSPRILRARFELSEPLSPGRYGLALWANGEILAERFSIIQVGDDVDAGPVDGGPGEDDPDTGTGLDGGAPLDAETPDTAVVDGGPPDSGLGPFLVDARYRRAIQAPTTTTYPAGATLIVSLDHAALVATAKSRPQGEDLRVYQGTTPLTFQFADRFALETDNLELVVRLDRDVPVGGDPSAPLVLYYGNLEQSESVASDAAFVFVERFGDLVVPFDPDDTEDSWYEAGEWALCDFDRPTMGPIPVGFGTYCVADQGGAGLTRQTLATPRLRDVRVSIGRPLGTRYEMRFWLAGRMTDGPADILYLSHHSTNRDFALTTEFPADAYDGYPLETLSFIDVDGDRRTVSGWRLPSVQFLWWAPVILRFDPVIDRPSLHLRYISTAPNGTVESSVTIVDDWWVRLAMDPEPQVVLGAEEARP